MGTGERTGQAKDGTIRIAFSANLSCEVNCLSYAFFASSTVLPAVPLAMDVPAC
jgi:hypothetical protein